MHAMCLCHTNPNITDKLDFTVINLMPSIMIKYFFFVVVVVVTHLVYNESFYCTVSKSMVGLNIVFEIQIMIRYEFCFGNQSDCMIMYISILSNTQSFILTVI